MIYICLRPMRSEKAPAMGTQNEPRTVPIIKLDNNRLREAPEGRSVSEYENAEDL